MNDSIKHKKFTPKTSQIIKCTKLQSLNFEDSQFNIKHGFTKLKNTKVKKGHETFYFDKEKGKVGSHMGEN